MLNRIENGLAGVRERQREALIMKMRLLYRKSLTDRGARGVCDVYIAASFDFHASRVAARPNKIEGREARSRFRHDMLMTHVRFLFRASDVTTAAL